MQRFTTFQLFATLLLIANAAPSYGYQNKPKYQDFAASPEERAADLVSQMTLEEKVEQMQNTAPAIPRLGIPAYDWWNEALHGVARAGLATVFPQAIGLAATWDTDLEYRIADAISTEARAKYNDAIKHDNHGRYYGLTFWSPNINIFRDPRWGRGQETYGEDPYLTSRMAIAFIKGMQGSDRHYFKTIATSKHFAVHSGPETSRHQFDAKPTDFDLEHTYLPAFQATITEGGADSVMCAYNRVNGAPACASTFLLQDKLRDAWHFKGYVVSDCGAIADIYEGHHYADSMAEASAKAVKAGTDLTCGREYKTLVEAIQKGYIQERELDESLKRLFVARFRLGMFDPPDRVPFSKIGRDEVESPAHQKLALEAAEKSLVLLKNENQTLPLRNRPKRIAVLGPAADDPDTLLGNYNGLPSRIITPLEGIEQQFGKTSEIRFALGSTYVSSSLALVSQNVLRPSDGKGNQHGLLAEYFGNDNLSGKPQLSRVEKREYFVWDMQDPAIVKAVPRQSFSVRWSGIIEVRQTGDYQLGVVRAECHACGRTDSAQVYVDDQLTVDDNRRAGETTDPKTATVHLEAGKGRRIRIEYKETGGGGGVQLLWRPPAEATLADAVEAAKQSDLAIVCIGLNSRLEGEESKVEIPGFSGGDRTNLDLPEPQERLLGAVLDTGKPTVVVLINGSALAVKSAKGRAAAILEGWYPGQEGGTAIAEALAGTYNPSGRLPVTFYESADQLPPFTDYSMKGRTYRYFTGQPLYPFGYGLSYSDFAYSDLSVKYNVPSSKLEITGTVTNHSSYDGDEVAQLYISREDSSNRELKGFQRIHLARGEKKQLRFVVEYPGGVSQTSVSLGGGQPLKDWTSNHYVQVKFASQTH
ncbi:MAG: glycoside hydrolase family 3 C-terminal domain-containing protein [Acidobacteriaceae bacterium]|nr:glycoside hydrolase family 3 C-terminal domain-containing protein [Acidobacteriaceae bacterium]